MSAGRVTSRILSWTRGGPRPRGTAALLWRFAALACFAGILAAVGLGLTAVTIKG